MPPELLRIPLPGDVPAEHAVYLVAGDDRPFALCGKWAGSRAIVGSEPLAESDPFEALAIKRGTLASDTDGQAPHFVGGGWFGVLNFPLGRGVERIGHPPPRPTPSPPTLLRF